MSLIIVDVVPDILVVGKPLGNGFPMAMVVTSKEIADTLNDFTSAVSVYIIIYYNVRNKLMYRTIMYLSSHCKISSDWIQNNMFLFAHSNAT